MEKQISLWSFEEDEKKGIDAMRNSTFDERLHFLRVLQNQFEKCLARPVLISILKM